MKTEQEWLDIEKRLFECLKGHQWGDFEGFARNEDGTLYMFDGAPVPQSVIDLFNECDARRAKLVEQGINPYDDL